MSLYRSFAFSVFDHINTLLTFICSQLQSGVLTQTNQKCKTCGSKLFTLAATHICDRNMGSVLTGRCKALRCSEGETFTGNFYFSFGTHYWIVVYAV